jgi:Fe-S-cluster containining protein
MSMNEKLKEDIFTKRTLELEKMIEAKIGSIKNNIKALESFYKYTDEFMREIEDKTPCKKGCSHCCKSGMRIDISELEANYIKHKLGIANNTLNVEEKGYIPQGPCPFLINDSCSIYEIRPYQCRRHVVIEKDNTKCIKNSLCMQPGSEEFDSAYHALVKKYLSKKQQKLDSLMIQINSGKKTLNENELISFNANFKKYDYSDIRIFFPPEVMDSFL